MRKPHNKTAVNKRDVYVCRANQKTTFQNIQNDYHWRLN